MDGKIRGKSKSKNEEESVRNSDDECQGKSCEVIIKRGKRGHQGPQGPRGIPGPPGSRGFSDTIALSAPLPTAANPPLSFANSSNTGIYSPVPGKFNIVENGAVVFTTNKGASSLAVGTSLTNSAGANNTAVGQSAMISNTTGQNNTAVGQSSMASNVSGERNVAVGSNSLRSSVGAWDNTAVGTSALISTTGGNNTAVGSEALSSNTSGTNNVAIGRQAGQTKGGTGDNNIYISNNAATSGESNTIRIGNSSHTNLYLAGTGPPFTGSAVLYIDTTNGKVTHLISSKRYKEDIQPIMPATDILAKLRPVSFKYTEPASDKSKPIQFGLIAEEVETVFPPMTIYKDGVPESVAYQFLPILLLKGYQEQQAIIAAQQAIIAAQQVTIDNHSNEIARISAEIANLKK